jgi:hypothetical protein
MSVPELKPDPAFRKALAKRVGETARAGGVVVGNPLGQSRMFLRALRPLMPVCGAALFAGFGFASIGTFGASGRLGLLSWASLGVSLLMTSAATHRLTEHPDLLTAALLPVDEKAVLKRQLRRMGVGTAAFVVPVWLALLMFFGISPLSLAGLVALVGAGCVVVQSALVAAVSLRIRLLGHLLLPGLVFGGGIAVFLLLKNASLAGTVALVDSSGPWLQALLPAGWAIAPLRRAVEYGEWVWLGPMLGAAWISGWMIRGLLRGLLHGLRPRDTVLANYAAQLPDDVEEAVARDFNESLVEPVGPGVTAIRDRILSREFLRPIRPSPSDPLTLLAWRWWSPRERLLGEWGYGAWPEWWRSTQRTLLLLLGAAIVAVVVRPKYPDAAVWAMIVGCLVAALRQLPLAVGLDRGTAARFTGNGSISGMLVMPVTWNEVRRMTAKTAYVRTLVALPVSAMTGFLVAWVFALPMKDTVLIALKIPLGSLVLRSLFVPVSIASNRFDGFWMVMGAIVAVVCGILLCLLLIAGVAVPGFGGMTALAIAWVFARGLEAVTAKTWSRRRFEGIPKDAGDDT